MDQKYHMGRVLGLIGKYEDLKQQDGESVQFWVDETLSAATAAHEVRYHAWILISV